MELWSDGILGLNKDNVHYKPYRLAGFGHLPINAAFSPGQRPGSIVPIFHHSNGEAPNVYRNRFGRFREVGSGKSYSKSVRTLQDRQIFILSCQRFCTTPSHMVPLMNQHRSPLWNSQAGHWFLCSGEHFLISQQYFRFLFFEFNFEIRK